MELVESIVGALLHDRTITRADDVSRRFGLPARTLQRLFRRYVDQSHFIRDFTAAIGMTPVAYAQACRRRAVPVSV